MEWEQASVSLCLSLSFEPYTTLVTTRYLLHFYLSKEWLLAILCAYIWPWQPSNSILTLPVNITFQHNLITIKISLLVSLFQILWHKTRIGQACLVFYPQTKRWWPGGQSLFAPSGMCEHVLLKRRVDRNNMIKSSFTIAWERRRNQMFLWPKWILDFNLGNFSCMAKYSRL